MEHQLLENGPEYLETGVSLSREGLEISRENGGLSSHFRSRESNRRHCCHQVSVLCSDTSGTKGLGRGACAKQRI